MAITVEAISNLLDKFEIKGNKDNIVSGIASDSREVKPGYIFVCIKGLNVDGHNYIDKAIANGATAIVVSEEVNVPTDIAVIKVDNTREAMLKIAAAIYGDPSQKMRMIGVTGTNGKTTTTHIISHILQENGYKTGIIGTVNVNIAGKILPAHNTTPDAAELQSILNMMVAEKVDYCLMEVSSHALDLRRVSGIEFDEAVFTNLTQDHLDYHKSFENYFAAKAKLFASVNAQDQYKNNKGNIINLDDEYGSKMLELCQYNTLTYAINSDADLKAINIEIDSKNTKFDLSYKNTIHSVKTSISGLFNVYNTLAAIGSCLLEGLNLEDIIRALSTFKAVPGRFELVEEGQPFAVVVDYAHTPDGLENILKTAKDIVENEIIVVFGCGGDRDATKRPIMGAIASKYADKIIVTSDNPRTEDPQKIVEQVATGVHDNLRLGSSYKVIVDRKMAIKEAINMAQRGDIVMIAGKGHEDYQILKDKTIHFDDREVARWALKEAGYNG